MRVVCPNIECKAEYDIEPQQIPIGKTGFKCAQCAGFVPVDRVTDRTDAHTLAPSQGTPKSLVIILVVALLMIVGGAGFFYYQLQLINQGSLVMQNHHNVSLSAERLSQLKEKLHTKEQAQENNADTPPSRKF